MSGRRRFPLFYWENWLVIEHIFEYNGCMELGDPTAGERTERSRLDVILDKLNDVFAELLDTVGVRRS